ncbi:MAG: glutathione synthase, partial [Limnohabitans sp.]
MNLLFVCDPLSSFHIEKDSTFTMMREALKRGHRVWACHTSDLSWQSGSRVSALMQRISLTGHALEWFTVEEKATRSLMEMNAVLMRKDPPFDSEYFYATHLLSQAEHEGAKVFNQPHALREHPEKLALMSFAEFVSPTLVTRNPQAIREFHARHQDIILKPLDGMGGMGIFR